MIEPKTTLAAAAVGAGGYAGYMWLRPSIATGHPSPANEERLRGGAGSGREFAVEGGGLAWDNRWDRWAQQNDGYIRDRSGRKARIGTPAAAFIAYATTVEMLDLSNRFARIFFRACRPDALRRMYEGFISSGQYDLGALNSTELGIITQYVGVSMEAITSLRILSRMYRAARMRPHTTPSRYRNRLNAIVAGDMINPLANHDSGEAQRQGYAIGSASDWEAVAIQAMNTFMAAYPDLTTGSMDERDTETLREDIDRFTEAGTDDRIENPAPVVAVALYGALKTALVFLVPILVRAGVLVILGSKTLGAIQEMVNASTAFRRVEADHYDRLLEKCEDGDQAACQRAEAFAETIQKYQDGWLEKGLMWSVVIAVVGGGGYLGYRYVRGRRGRRLSNPTPAQRLPA